MITQSRKERKEKVAMEKAENLEWAREHSSIVNAVLNSGGSTEDCVVALLKQNAELIKRLLYLEGIAPKKIRIGDQVVVWHCPDEFIPEV